VKPAETAFARQWLSSHYAMAETYTHATIEEILEAVFSMLSVPRLNNEKQLPLKQSLETAVRSVGGWCEMAASL
jgi:hypothetical protein